MTIEIKVFDLKNEHCPLKDINQYIKQNQENALKLLKNN